jgi:serine/threonine protein phosphatase PrpC
MPWNADAAFRIGVDHDECQDNVSIAKNRKGNFIAISDGCSSSMHSDWGSKILTVLAASYWEAEFALERIPEECIFRANNLITSIPVAKSALDATLICATIVNDICNIIMWGDGTIIITHPNGTWMTISIEYKSNSPEYLAYLLNPTRHAQYQELLDHTKEIVISSYSSENKLTDLSTLESIKQFETYQFDNIDTVLICSDGISSFMKRNALNVLEPYPLAEVAKELIAIPNRNGEYLKRRWKKMRNKFEKNSIMHTDDFSVASLIKVP